MQIMVISGQIEPGGICGLEKNNRGMEQIDV